MSAFDVLDQQPRRERSSPLERAHLPLVIFDGDDTLWSTQRLYTDAKAVLYGILQARGFAPTMVAQQLDLIEQRKIRDLSYSPERFPQSLVACYRLLLARTSLPERDRELQRIEQAGRAVFSRRARLAPEVRAILRRLRPHYRLALHTKGDRGTQRKRLRDSGLESLFDYVTVVDEKSPATFADLLRLADSDADDAWSVGNSVRSDINPALSTGMRAIWVQSPSWLHEQEEPVPSPRLFVARSLADILALLL